MAAKTVRGAYMWQERQRAKELGYADRVQPDFAATTANYHSCVDFLLRRCPSSAHLVVAGHNEQTVRWVTGRMAAARPAAQRPLRLLRSAAGHVRPRQLQPRRLGLQSAEGRAVRPRWRRCCPTSSAERRRTRTCWTEPTRRGSSCGGSSSGGGCRRSLRSSTAAHKPESSSVVH